MVADKIKSLWPPVLTGGMSGKIDKLITRVSALSLEVAALHHKVDQLTKAVDGLVVGRIANSACLTEGSFQGRRKPPKSPRPSTRPQAEPIEEGRVKKGGVNYEYQIEERPDPPAPRKQR